jgi:hypothetical protein
MHGARSTEQRPTRNQTTRSEVRKQCQKVFWLEQIDLT